jgi:hypothetical protein
MDSGSELGKAYCLINLGLMGMAVLLRRPVFMVFGALGVAAYLGYLSYEVFADSLLFPVVVTLIGLGLSGWAGLPEAAGAVEPGADAVADVALRDWLAPQVGAAAGLAAPICQPSSTIS